MKTNIASFSQRYQDELQKHLEHGRRAAPQVADQLGREALDLGLETPDPARLHEQTLASFVSSERTAKISGAVIRRTHCLFVKALMRLEKTHKTAIQANTRLQQRPEELTTANRAFKKEIAPRLDVEKALKQSEQDHRQLLKQSQSMQEQLRGPMGPNDKPNSTQQRSFYEAKNIGITGRRSQDRPRGTAGLAGV